MPDWPFQLTPLLIAGIKDIVVFWFSHLELIVEGQDNALGFALPLRQQSRASFWNLLGWIFFPHSRWEMDESVSCSPCWLFAQDGQRQQRGICTMQYFPSVIIVLLLFYLVLILWLSVGILVLYCMFSFLFLICHSAVQTCIASKQLEEDGQATTRSFLKTFYFESAKNHKFDLVAEPWEDNKVRKHTDFFL